MSIKVERCQWSKNDEAMRQYHDEEWGVPVYDSRVLWEMLMLEGFQAGLSWAVVLKKRDALRRAFKNFDPKKVAELTDIDIEIMLQDPSIIRSRSKIKATISGAKAYLAMEESGEDFSDFVWDLAGGKPTRNTASGQTQSALSEKYSTELKIRGFRFVGPVITYAWMQAVGIVDDHCVNCFRRKDKK